MDYKICYVCEDTLPLDSFYKNRSRSDGHSAECKTCGRKVSKDSQNRTNYKASNNRRNTVLKHRYGISLEEYNKLSTTQNNVCAICGDSGSMRNGKFYRLSVDHDHTTNKVRGLLCDKHNKGLGCFNDDPAELLSGYNYLKKWNQ